MGSSVSVPLRNDAASNNSSQFQSAVLEKYGQNCNSKDAATLLAAVDDVKSQLCEGVMNEVSRNLPAKFSNNTKNSLHLAAKVGDIEDIILFCMDQANLDLLWRRDDFDNIPLYYACLNGHTLCCAWLLLYMRLRKELYDPFQVSVEMERFIINSLNSDIKLLLKNKTDCKGQGQHNPDAIQ